MYTYTCIYIYIYIYTYTCVYVYMCILYICVYIYIYIYIYILFLVFRHARGSLTKAAGCEHTAHQPRRMRYATIARVLNSCYCISDVSTTISLPSPNADRV